MQLFKKVAAAGAAMIAMTALSTVGASPANAATYGGQCGAGYHQVNWEPIPHKGAVYLTYNKSTGKNCVVTVRHKRGKPVPMDAELKVYGTSKSIVDSGKFKNYAGPVYVNARGKCVTWGGRIDGGKAFVHKSNCR
ncbi:hypothetical protein SAMN05421505_15025 [Sinosporangium album]|uniref:Spore-associated protein A n=1 Tax=Sinosporangium album TaxID=504805 RepID=A0A1G8KHF3_9ACTN|nr:hypothetical protein [Sinosporangium album]SDI42310.1 hypothetical protein SAMN05421505_15025 [Sinosporangium album]